MTLEIKPADFYDPDLAALVQAVDFATPLPRRRNCHNLPLEDLAYPRSPCGRRIWTVFWSAWAGEGAWRGEIKSMHVLATAGKGVSRQLLDDLATEARLHPSVAGDRSRSAIRGRAAAL